MESAVSTIKGKTKTLKGNFVWSNPDLPLHVRTPFSFLFGLKKLLTSESWEFSKSEIYVKEDAPVMEFCKKEVLEVSVQESRLKFKWLDSSWEKWDELQKKKDFQELVKKFNDTLLKGSYGKKGAAKGIGKGPE